MTTHSLDRLASFGAVRAVNASKNTVDVVASTENIARDDAVILATAWTVNGGLDRYKRNPVVLLAHDDKAPPIARAARVEVVNKELQATIEFDAGDTAAMDIFRKVRTGFLSAVSVRWIPRKSTMEMRSGRQVLVFQDVELLEMSFVSLPADADALAIRDGATMEPVNIRKLASRLSASVGATDHVRSRLERAWTRPDMSLVERSRTMRANLELAGILFGAKASVSRATPLHGGTRWAGQVGGPSDEFLATWRSIVFDGEAPSVAGSRGQMRAMDTAETGFGLELVGTSFEDALWVAARSSDLLINMIETVQAQRGGHGIASSSGISEMSLVPESTSDAPTAYGAVGFDTARKTSDGQKLTIQTIVSGELVEDSIIDLVPTLRVQNEESFKLHLGSAYLNGDTTATATGNINLDDSAPAATKHYLAFDGMRHSYLVENTTQGYSAAAGVDQGLIDRLRGYLSRDIAESIEDLGQDFGAVADDLLIICDRFTLRQVRALAQFVDAAVIPGAFPGEEGRVGGIRVFSPSYCVRTAADGKVEAAANGTYGQLTMVNRRGFKGVQTGGVRFYFERVQRTDQHVLEVYTRQDLKRHSITAAAGAYGLVV